VVEEIRPVKKQSAGLIMFRVRENVLEALLAHPGGPFWRSKDAGAWTIPKGEIDNAADALATAQREFEEETGFKPIGPFHSLGSVIQKSGKVVHVWAFRGDCDPSTIRSNFVEIEWPPRSGRRITIPEIDRAAFFNLREASQKLNPAQVPFLTRLEEGSRNARFQPMGPAHAFFSPASGRRDQHLCRQSGAATMKLFSRRQPDFVRAYWRTSSLSNCRRTCSWNQRNDGGRFE
jgi:predicted NUDIX family NTP pyrophosphohydrolase